MTITITSAILYTTVEVKTTYRTLSISYRIFGNLPYVGQGGNRRKEVILLDKVIKIALLEKLLERRYPAEVYDTAEKTSIYRLRVDKLLN